MNEDGKKCWSCSSFRVYYTRGFCCLVRENNGYCIRYGKIMLRSDRCEKWHCNYISREKRIKIALNSIPEIYQTVAAIEQLLKEEKEQRVISNEIYKDGK